MDHSLAQMIAAYDTEIPLAEASTIPASWYIDPRIAALERRAVFSRNWQMVARLEQLTENGRYVSAEVANEPVVVVRGEDGILRAFFNVCRHHAAAVVTQPQGCVSMLRCPYHGWTYGLDGALKGIPEFVGVRHFERSSHGLVPLAVATWEQFVFVHLEPDPVPLAEAIGPMAGRVSPLALNDLHFVERRTYTINCNWKVFVDNYLDGGYHVPHLHKSLHSVLDYVNYTIENGSRFCLQTSPVRASGADAATAAVRAGQAFYFWFYPNFMINWYDGVMDTNLVRPLGTNQTEVIFDFYFRMAGAAGEAHRGQSMAVSERIQEEDVTICESVQRGLMSRAYRSGRLSVRREAGEYLFHRLLARDLQRSAAP